MRGSREVAVCASALQSPTIWVTLSALLLTAWQFTHLRSRLATRELDSSGAQTAQSRHILEILDRWAIPASSPFLDRAGETHDPTTTPSTADTVLAFSSEGPLDVLTKAANPPVTGVHRQQLSADDCADTHPNADSKAMLHVVYASDMDQVEGVQASIASVVSSTNTPEQLTVHIMVQASSANAFKKCLRMRPECHGIVTVTGVLIRIHEIDPKIVSASVAIIPKKLANTRGKISSIENYARFYMHQVIGNAVVIYLDADTIVHADLATLQKHLISSNKTIGFVARESKVTMSSFVRNLTRCSGHIPNLKEVFAMEAYNVGVFAVNLQRWMDNRITERVEHFVNLHNKCGGRLFIGGSQPPLLLAFLSRPAGQPEDFLVFHQNWNTDGLGWNAALDQKRLRTSYILHWNGVQKPWSPNGLYVDLWRKHRKNFESQLMPYVGQAVGDNFTSDHNVADAKKSNVTQTKKANPLSREEVEAMARCPNVRMIAEWPSEQSTNNSTTSACKMGQTYGCRRVGMGMWVNSTCSGVFSVDSQVTACGEPRMVKKNSEHQCEPGNTVTGNQSCGLMILTTFFVTKVDWQRAEYIRPAFEKIRTLYGSVARHGLSLSLFYDDLSEKFVRTYSSPNFRFVKVNLTDFDPRYGVNDVRYFIFEREIIRHPEWKYLFVVDAFDVEVRMNPCTGMQPGMLYINHERDKLRRHPWMKVRYQKMGGKYEKWYRSLKPRLKILNCGLTGGSRDIMLKLIKRMLEVLQDPSLAIMKQKEDININMAALNWILYNEFEGQFKGNAPIHSQYKKYENNRNDVWFVHK